MFRDPVGNLLAGFAIAVCFVGHAHGDDTSFDHRSAIKAATATLEKEHYSHRKLDDKLSAEWLAAFVAELDPRRMYLLQADIADFQAFERRLDDHAKTGDFQFPDLFRSRYRQRVASATAHAGTFIDAHHDYSADESFPRSFDAYARSEEERRERWRLRIKCELLIEKVHGRPLEEVRAHLRARYERIEKQARELSDAELCETYLDSLVKLYDPHSRYWGESFGYRAPTYGLGIGWRENKGGFLVTGIHTALRNEETFSLIGWELMAIKRTNGVIVDLVEMRPDDVYHLIMLPTRALQSDQKVVLELLHPDSLERKSVEWKRIMW